MSDPTHTAKGTDNGTEPVPRLALNRVETAHTIGFGVRKVDELITGRVQIRWFVQHAF